MNQRIHRISKELFTENVRIYDQVNDEQGKSILDQNRNGKEVVFNSVVAREITYEYIGNKLKNIYYLDNNGEKIYQFCQKNAKLTDLKDLQKSIEDNFKYPVESTEKYNHGYVLVKCIVEPTGLVSEVKLIRGLDVACNSILDFCHA